VRKDGDACVGDMMEIGGSRAQTPEPIEMDSSSGKVKSKKSGRYRGK